MPRIHAWIVPLVLLACGDDGSSTTTDDGTGSTGSTDGSGGTEPTTGAQAPAVTYHRDVKAILDARCVQCHSPGNLGPFSLATYAEASAVAATLMPAITAQTMPPWPPDNDCRTYLHDRSLTEEQQQTIATWVELGAPEGDPAEAAPPPAPPAPIEFDIELDISAPYTPTVAPDEYRCFLIPWPEDQDTYVTALSVTPGNRQIVHHVIAFAIPPEQAAAYQALDDEDPDPGYLCYGGPSGGKLGTAARVPWLGAWVPGGDPGAMPEGTGLLVHPGSLIAVQMHYHAYPGAGPDQSQIQIRTADSVDRVAVMAPFANPAWPQNTQPMLIPAGDPDVVHSFETPITDYLAMIFPPGTYKAGDPFVVHTASLHLHTRGASARLSVVGEQDTCLLDIPRWDFNWQGAYQLAEPVTVNAADKLRIECKWDNSKANQPFENGAQVEPADIYWGEGTDDEMCLGIVYVTAE